MPAPPAFDWDVFLSHHASDKPRVRRLAERLRDAGLRVWLDEWVIQPGDDIYLAVERGLGAARVQVLCLSPAALGSDWVALERSSVLFRDPTNAGRRFVPVLLADAELPDALRRYKYVDLRDDTDAAFRELLKACRAPKRRAGRQKTAASAGPPAVGEIAGHWTVTAREGAGEPYRVFLTLRKFDEVLLGTVSYPTGNGSVNGKVDGESISFETRHVPNFSSQEATIQWHARIEGQELRGFAGQAEFTATRSETPQRYEWVGRGTRSSK